MVHGFFSAVFYCLDDGIKLETRAAGGIQDIDEVRDGAANVAAEMNLYQTWLFPTQPDFETFLTTTGIEGDYLATVLSQDNTWKGYGFYPFTE